METYQYGWEKNMDNLSSQKIWFSGLSSHLSKIAQTESMKGVFIRYPYCVKGYKMQLLEEKKCATNRNNAMFYRGLSLQGSAQREDQKVSLCKKSEDKSEEAQEDLSNHQLLMIKNVDTLLNLQETMKVVIGFCFISKKVKVV